MKNLKDSKLILNESEVIPMIISLVPFRTFRGPLFPIPKPFTGQELFFAVSYSKPANPGEKLKRNPGVQDLKFT